MADFSSRSGAPTNAGPSRLSGAGLGGAPPGAAPARVSPLGNPILPVRARASASAVATTATAAAAPVAGAPTTSAPAANSAIAQFPPWTRPLEQGRTEILSFITKLRAGHRATAAEVARRQESVCSFLWHLEFGLGEPTPVSKGYPHRVDEALRSLTKEENREIMPEEVSRWAATITAKFERDNWSVSTPNNNNNANNNNANNIGESEDEDDTASAEDSEESDEDAAPAPAPAPAPILAVTAVAATATTPAFRLPPPNHPIWGTAGVMHGVYIRWQHGRRYGLDPRYAHQKRDAAVFGHNGLAPGAWWPLQVAAWFAGAHGSHIKGIFGSVAEGAYSVVVSGAATAYHGQNGDRDRGTVLFYSADSPDRNDTAAPSADTRALLRSEQTRRPVTTISDQPASGDTRAPGSF